MNDATPSRGALPAIAVGGGLAGAAFAIALARSGRRVLVLERSRGPHHTVCGEFLSEEAQVVLGSLGIDPQVLGATTITHFRLVKGERQATVRLPFAAAGLSRFRIDEALLAAAHAPERRWCAVLCYGDRVRRWRDGGADRRPGVAGQRRGRSPRASIPCAALPAPQARWWASSCISSRPRPPHGISPASCSSSSSAAAMSGPVWSKTAS